MPAALPRSNGTGAKTTEDRLSFLVVLYLICVVLPITVHLGSVVLTTLRMLLLVVSVPMLVSLLLGRYGRTIPTDWLFLGHALWLTAALALNNPDRVVQQAPSVGVEFLGGYVVARACIRSRAQFVAMCRVLMLIVLALVPFALLETQTGAPALLKAIRALPGVTSVELVYADKRLGLERVQSVFAHPIHHGLFCSVVFSLVSVGLWGQMARTKHILLSGILALMTFLALSSGALLALALQFGLIAWSLLFRRVEARWRILVATFVALWILVDILSNRGPIQVFMSYATFSAHTAYWRSIIFEWGVMNVFGSAEHGIPSAFFFGIGLNEWIRPAYMHSGSMDNFWLVMAVRYGFPGFLLIALGFAVQVTKLMRLRLAPGHPSLMLRRACVFTFLGLSFTLATVHVWSNIFSFVIFFIGATAWMVQPGAMEEDTPAPSEPGGRRVPSYSRFAPRGGRAPAPYRRAPQ